jgi:hypothetical protein
MADIQNNSTDIPLGAFQKFTGKSFKPSIDFITIAVALNTSSSGTLQFLHSFDDINYFTFGDEFSYTEGSHSRQVSIKGHYFKISFENGAVPQTSFNLYTRILKQINDDLNVTTKADEDTITVFPPQTGFLSSERDSITIPTLDDCITGINNDSLKVFVVNQSGGSASNVQIFDSNGSSLLSDGDGKLQVSGTFDVGLTNYALEDNGHLESIDAKLDIVQGLTFLNNKLLVETGLTNIEINNFLELQGLTFNVNIVNTEPITITGFNFQNYSTETKQDTQIEELLKVVDKKGDIEANIYYDSGAPVYADSTPTPQQLPQNASGWIYVNQNTGNAMNLFYFNGNNETKTLNQVVGQYAVVSNFSTKLLNKLIFAVYTKGSPFFTSRITHSQPSNVNLTAGGQFLCYWGSVDENICPNLPRLNFSDITTTGPAIPTEEILSVSLNTDSGATAGDVIIFVESLGVVFNNGSVNQSRVLNLLATETDYSIQTNILDTLQSINTGVNINNQITGFALESGGNLSTVATNTDKLKFTGDDLKTVISNTGFNVNNQITNFSLETGGNLATVATNSDKFKYTGDDLKTVISNTGFNVNNPITNFSLETGGNLSTVATNSAKFKFTGDDLKTVISNTGFNVNNPITNFSLETGGNLSTVATNTDKFKFTGDDLKTVISNQITGFALETGGNLAGIKTNTDKNTYSGEDLKTVISNTGFNVNNPITNFSLETGGNLSSIKSNTDKNTYTTGNLNVNVASGSLTVDSVNIKASNGDSLTATGTSLNTNLTNTSIDVHNKILHNSSWINLVGASNGHLLVNSSTQSGDGEDITSTTAGAIVGLDVASDLYAFDGTTRRRVLCDTSSRLFSVSNTRDGDNNPITSTTTTATTQSLDTSSSLYVADGTSRTPLTVTGSSLNANITNSSLTTSVSNSFTLDTTTTSTNTKIDSTNTKLDTGNGYLNTINNATGDFTTTFAFGNFISNVSLSGGADSSTSTFTTGSLKRNVIAIYRDGSLSNTDSISFYTVSTSGSPTNLLLGTVYPINIGGARQVTINLNLLPFNSLFIKNDSASTINAVYLTVLNG